MASIREALVFGRGRLDDRKHWRETYLTIESAQLCERDLSVFVAIGPSEIERNRSARCRQREDAS